MVVIVAILATIVAIWYKNNVYPYKYAEKFYEDNKQNIEHIVDYFGNLDNVYSAKMDTDGKAEIISANGSEIINCSADNGYKSLMSLREKYIEESDKKLYMLDFIYAQYDDKGGMLLEIPVYARILNTDTSVDTPNRIVYYLVYIDDNYSGDASIIEEEKSINSNWFVLSKKHTAG